VIGVLFLTIGVIVMFGLDKKIAIEILDRGYFDVTKIEQKLLETTP
jgi:anti-sigma regulatory factor (Ser/Thr protein kinase)